MNKWIYVQTLSGLSFAMVCIPFGLTVSQLKLFLGIDRAAWSPCSRDCSPWRRTSRSTSTSPTTTRSISRPIAVWDTEPTPSRPSGSSSYSLEGAPAPSLAENSTDRLLREPATMQKTHKPTPARRLIERAQSGQTLRDELLHQRFLVKVRMREGSLYQFWSDPLRPQLPL